MSHAPFLYMMGQIPSTPGLTDENLVKGFGAAGAVTIGILLLVIGGLVAFVKMLYNRIKEKDDHIQKVNDRVIALTESQTTTLGEISITQKTMVQSINAIDQKIDDIRINKSSCNFSPKAT